MVLRMGLSLDSTEKNHGTVGTSPPEKVQQSCTWRIIPVSKWIITMVCKWLEGVPQPYLDLLRGLTITMVINHLRVLGAHPPSRLPKANMTSRKMPIFQ